MIYVVKIQDGYYSNYTLGAAKSTDQAWKTHSLDHAREVARAYKGKVAAL